MKLTQVLAVVLVATSLTGCFGGKRGPDEMAVLDSVPLTLPPSFELRPPREGQTAEIRAAHARAEALVLGKTATARAAAEAETVKGDGWLVNKAGGNTRNKSIREIMAEEARNEPEQKGTWLDRTLGRTESAEPTIEELAEISRKEKEASNQ